MPEKVEGTWRLAPEAGAMGVGPAVGDYSYWSSSLQDVTDRACLYDDQYVFNADGSYKTVLGSETWLETYKLAAGADPACGAPVAPHDGTNPATWSIDATAGTITLVGEGAYLGLFKVTNTDGGDGDYVPAVDNTIVYNYTLSAGGTRMSVIIEPVAGLVWNFNLVKSDPSKFAGSWSMTREAGALGVGPALGDVSWWANSDADVTTRDCFFDDEYVFSADGSYSNVMGATTWLEAWQTGVDADGCGAPVAPHNGLSAATYSVDETAGTITIVGSGAFLGLAKAHNTGEDGAPANNTTVYKYKFSADGNNLDVHIEVGTGVFWQYKFTRNGSPPPVVTYPLEATTWKLRPAAGALLVGDGAGNTWWASNIDDVTTRACLFDDEYTFNKNGSFNNVLGTETWLEAWQAGVDADGCGAPVAPHDGSNAATWSMDETAGTITLVGSGAYLGLSKVHNTAEDGLPASNTITYKYTLSADTNRLDLTISGFNADVPAAMWEYEFVRKGSDYTPPAKVEDIVVLPGAYVNAVTWVDVPGEEGETYSVYASRKAFAADSPAAALIGNADVDLVAGDVAEDGGQANHDLTIPLSDRWATYYYAVVCTDAVGNKSVVSSTEAPVNNRSRGIPVISLSPPASFAADGDLSEWEASGIQPFQMGVTVNSMGAPKVIGTVDDDADASVKLYLAADDTVLYMAADVTDNDFNVGEGNWWEQDALELFIGLYNKRGARSGGFTRGSAPHYKLVFRGDTTWKEMGTNASLGKSGDGNYFNTGVVGSPDAIIEFKVRFDALAAIDGDSVFKPVKGMKIPIEPVWHDNDGSGWEGNIVMSKTNEDNAWQTPATWSHTFVGKYDGDVLSTDDLVATTFSLKENYPNPFNPTTTIEYSIAIAGPTTLFVYDVLGREVIKLVDEYRPIGGHKIVWNASNVPSGIYFYRIQTASFSKTRKMVLMK